VLHSGLYFCRTFGALDRTVAHTQHSDPISLASIAALISLSEVATPLFCCVRDSNRESE